MRRCGRSPPRPTSRSRRASAFTTGSSSGSCSSGQLADIVQPDLGHIGGIGETRKLAATAETYYRLIAPHNVGGAVLTAASLQVGFSTPNFKILEHFNDFADSQIKDVVTGAPEVVDGYFLRNDRPGLGVEFHKEAAAEFPQQRAHFDLWAEGWEKRAPKASR